jgi:hypothetical protein
LVEGKLYLFNKPDPNRPIETKYVTEIEGQRKYFVHQEDALLYLFDSGVKTYKFLTKEDREYKDLTKLLTYELWHIKNRIGYVQYDFESYIDEDDEVKRRRAFVWRFVGFGRSCFAKTKEELEEKVLLLINHYNEDPEASGHNTYPYYTRHYR